MRAQQYSESSAVDCTDHGFGFGSVGIAVFGLDWVGMVVLVQGSVGTEALVVGQRCCPSIRSSDDSSSLGYNG